MKQVWKGTFSAIMAVTMLAGCSSTAAASPAATASAAAATTAAGAASAGTFTPDANDGKVVNIYVWNDEFKTRFEDYYADKFPAGYTYNFVTTPSDNNAYQNALDEALLNQDSAAADDKVDMFLVEADYILKYVNSDYTLDLNSIGVTADDMKNQYEYTKTIAQDSNSTQKGISWQACPGLYIYRRSIAKQVLGSDDPAEVQKSIGSWDDFDATAEKVKEAGYTMVSGYDDSYRVFSNNVSNPWVDSSNKVQIDPQLEAWVKQTKDFTEKGYNNKTSLWNDAWAAGMGSKGNVFGYFMPAWGVDFVMNGNSLDTSVDAGGKEEVGNGTYGDWAATVGPQSYNWGGTWLCAAAGTDDADIVADIMKTICCDEDTLTKIVEEKNDFANNSVVMEKMASSDFSSAFLGGQNPLGMYCEAAKNISMDNISAYDQGLNEEFQGAMKDYYDGNVDYDTALQNFYKAAKVKYPDLTTD